MGVGDLVERQHCVHADGKPAGGRALEQVGLLTRTVTPSVPITVVY